VTATIRDIQLIPIAYDLPAGTAYGSARGMVARRAATIVQVLTSDGITGIGEAWGPPEALAGYLETARGCYIGRSIFDQRAIWHLVLAKQYHFGTENALTWLMGGIDIALYDAIGKTLGIPVYQLLGGKVRDRIPVYASGGYITRDPANQLAVQLHRLQGRGFQALKIKIGLNPRSDAERVALARQLFPSAALMVDANGNYTLDLARESMRRIEEYGVFWYEEPLAPQDLEGYRALTASSPIPIATGEALYAAFDFDRMLSMRALDIAQPDLTLCGGLTQGRLVADLCLLRHARLSPHVWGGAVGLAAALHLMAAHPAYPHSDNEAYPPYLEYDAGVNPLRDELLTTPLAPIDGFIAVPGGAGLGVDLNAEALNRFSMS
jgi:D-galactarolactone cycloisomerase